MPTPRALGLVYTIRALQRPGDGTVPYSLSVDEAAEEIDRFAAQRGAEAVQGGEFVDRHTHEMIVRDHRRLLETASARIRELEAESEGAPPQTGGDDAVPSRSDHDGIIAAEARRHYALSPYEQGREAKAKGKSIDNPYLTGSLADQRWIAGYRGEPDPPLWKDVNLMPLAQTGSGDAPKTRGKKYNATRMDIVNDFYDEIQGMITKYAGKPDALAALDEIESIAVWWANAPAVVRPSRATQSTETGGGAAGERARALAFTVIRALPFELKFWTPERVAEAIHKPLEAALRSSHREGAEAMREALRQPTKAMVEAGADRHRDDDCCDDEELAREMWRAMYAKVALPIPGSK